MLFQLITGNFIQNFSFFSIFFLFLKFKSKIYTRFLLTSAIICILGLAILFSGNRMPLILFLLGLATVFLFRNELRKIILVSLVALLTLATFAISYDERIKDSYYSLYSNTIGIAIWAITKKNPFKTNNIFVKKNEIETKSEAPDAKVENKNFFFFLSYNENIRLITSSLDVWSRNKIFGNGIKSFRVDCLRLFANNPKYTIDQPRSIENLLVFKTPNEESENEGERKIGRLCSNHPHNYYIQILTETGIVGFVVISIIAFLFLNFVFKNLKFLKESNMGNFLVLACVISLFLAMFPFRTTGGFFSTSNITYIVLVSSIILSYKKKSIIKKSTNLF